MERRAPAPGGQLPPRAGCCLSRAAIDFAGLADALLRRGVDLVSSWLPGGVQRGHEYVCADLSGGAGQSCSVNLNTGAWGDFAAGVAGKDFTSLYAAIHGIGQAEAARELYAVVGWADDDGVQAPAPVRAPPVRQAAAPSPARADEGWVTQRPVPAHAPAPTFKHTYRQPQDIEHTAEYRSAPDELHGYIVRFRTSDGGKDPLPYTWCTSARDGAARWHWKQFDEPRPLYLPSHRMPGGRTVLLVEGEKKADALQALLDAGAPGIYCVASWPGGCKAWKKAEWAWLAGLHVVAWPDCDAKREAVPKAAQKSVVGQALTQLEQLGGEITDADREQVRKAALELAASVMPLLPAEKQPGMLAMLGIGALLRDVHGCVVRVLPIPQPGEVADGWDCGDAINTDGWDFTRVMAFMAQAYALPGWAGGDKPATKAAAGAQPEPSGDGGGAGGGRRDSTAGASSDDDAGDAFADHLAFICEQMKCQPYEVGVNRKLLIAALTKASAIKDCLGYNELTNSPGTVVPWPWRETPGPLGDTDDLRLGDWLSREYKLKAASRAALAEAIDTVADMRRYHPIRDWLKGLAWDGKPRLAKWLMHVLDMDPATLPARRHRYLALVGRYMLMGLVARVMDPGVKFDYSPVFEGPGGIGKSTFVAELVGRDFFSDTHFDIGNGKEGMEQLEGLWAYELSELTAFKRADSEQIKQFFSSTVDRFRGAYGKFVQQHKRQCVIFCTTNKRQYLYDLTGNRRFWPVWIERQIKLAWLRKWRDQLFAEAYAAWAAGERFTPTHAEEEDCFVPEQMLRLVETTVQSKLYELLTRIGAEHRDGSAAAGLNQTTTFVTLHGLVQALGADAAKSTSLLETQIRGWLESNGWEMTRESTGQRRRGYMAPKVWPPAVDDEESPAPAHSAVAADQPPTADAEPARVLAPDGISDDDPF